MTNTATATKPNPLVTGKILVQVGKGKGAYTTRYAYPDTQRGDLQARFAYRCLNTFGGHKKRLVGPDGTIREKFLS